MSVIKTGKQLLLETVFVQAPNGNIPIELLEPGFVFPVGTTSFVQTTKEIGHFTKVSFEKTDLSGLVFLKVINAVNAPMENGYVKQHLAILVK